MTIKVPNILMPNNSVDLSRWAVIACDQFTSQPEYWDKVNALTQSHFSTRHITLPEIYLSRTQQQDVDDINAQMREYLRLNVLEDIGKCFVLVVRSTPFTPRRVGIMLAVDLEDYDYSIGSTSAVRATEGTVLERIPPRVRIRKDAPLELPHIMLLYNDSTDSVTKPLLNNLDSLTKLYDVELMCSGGTVQGYRIDDTESVCKALYATQKGSILFAVGDGNHSLATAKAIWEENKKTLPPSELANHPSRYALVEAVNLYDQGITFEPIHRVVFNAPASLIDELNNLSGDATCRLYQNGKFKQIKVPTSSVDAIKAVQTAIDKHVKAGECEVDYVHGDKDVCDVADANKGSIAILLPTLGKDELFAYVEQYGALPRKTFSMGEAVEKRYYMEARKIK